MLAHIVFPQSDKYLNTLRTTAAAAAAKSLQSCPTLCDPGDGSPPGSPIPGILQARPLQWVAISFSNAGKWKVKVKSFSRVQLLATPWTAAYQAPVIQNQKSLWTELLIKRWGFLKSFHTNDPDLSYFGRSFQN